MSVGTPSDGMTFWWNKWIDDEQPVPVNQLPQPQAMTAVCYAHDFAEWFAKQCAEASHPHEERGAFEEWANEKGTFTSSWNGEFYDNKLHQAAWQGWQAALASRIRGK